MANKLMIDYDKLTLNINDKQIVHQLIFTDSIFLAFHCTKNKLHFVYTLLNEYAILSQLLEKERHLFAYVDRDLRFLREMAIRFIWTNVRRVVGDMDKQAYSASQLIYNASNQWLDTSMTKSEALKAFTEVEFILEDLGIMFNDFHERYNDVIDKFKDEIVY